MDNRLRRVFDFIKDEVYIDGTLIPGEGPLGCTVSVYMLDGVTKVTIKIPLTYFFLDVFKKWYFYRKIKELWKKLRADHFGTLLDFGSFIEGGCVFKMNTVKCGGGKRMCVAEFEFEAYVSLVKIPNASMYFVRKTLPDGTRMWVVDEVLTTTR
jgi:hypothetical protein